MTKSDRTHSKFFITQNFRLKSDLKKNKKNRKNQDTIFFRVFRPDFVPNQKKKFLQP